jgi:hypothetical protein
MKTIFILLTCILSLHIKAQPTDSTVEKLIGVNLQVIGNYLDKKENSLKKISDAVSLLVFLQMLMEHITANTIQQPGTWRRGLSGFQ